MLHNNRWRCDHGWDIDLDDGSSNYHIYNNLCLNGGIKNPRRIQRTVENNIIGQQLASIRTSGIDRSGDVFATTS